MLRSIVPEYVFLYGTLLPELAPKKMAGAISRLKLIAPATVPGCLYDLGSYPGAVLGCKGRIRGRLFELPDEKDVLKSFDTYEGFMVARPHASEFVRRKCRALLEDGRKVICWIYEYNRNPLSARAIAGGDYFRFIRGSVTQMGAPSLSFRFLEGQGGDFPQE